MMNEMSVSFPSCSANEGFARAAVAAFVAQLDPTVDELCDIKTAVSEAVTNCIVHAYRDTIGTVYINCKIFADGKVIVKVRDRGCGIPDIRQAMQPMFTTAEGERAGLGFAVMESFMDRLHVTSKPGRGTSVILQKTLERRPASHG
ncbi:MAG: anti-sigma F factor [Oscillospiraceae bacterium]|nr:anti-sigma F factor [Oscillospiraceae bacterium]